MAVKGHVSEEIVGAGEQDLEETTRSKISNQQKIKESLHLLLETQSACAIRVEKHHEAVELVLSDAVASLVSQEVEDLVRADEATSIAVEPLEG